MTHSMSKIHPTAVVDPSVRLGANVVVGPWCVIGPDCMIGEGTELVAHVHMDRDTVVGRENIIHPFTIVGGPPLADGVAFYISTGRSVFAEAERRGLVQPLEEWGVTFVLDTCTYVTSILRPGTRTVMTNSGKWAHYAPGNMGVDVVLATLSECVESATTGLVTWNRELFT